VTERVMNERGDGRHACDFVIDTIENGIGVPLELSVRASSGNIPQIRDGFSHWDYCAVASSGWNDPD
jgi:hypothetical protein